MTNRKIKDYHRNRLATLMVTENYKNICRVLLILNKLYPKTFYPKVLIEWLNAYADRCTVMNKYDQAGVYEIKFKEYADTYGIDQNACIEFVVKNNKEVKAYANKMLLARNVMLALIETCDEFGIGDKRLGAITTALLASDIKDPMADMENIGMKVDLSETEQIDYRTLKPKKQKEATYGEIKAIYKDLEGFKAYQDAMRGDNT